MTSLPIGLLGSTPQTITGAASANSAATTGNMGTGGGLNMLLQHQQSQQQQSNQHHQLSLNQHLLQQHHHQPVRSATCVRLKIFEPNQTKCILAAFHDGVATTVPPPPAAAPTAATATGATAATATAAATATTRRSGERFPLQQLDHNRLGRGCRCRRGGCRRTAAATATEQCCYRA